MADLLSPNQRRMGLRRFILGSAVPYWGIPTAVGVTFFRAYLRADSGGVVFDGDLLLGLLMNILFIGLGGGALFGYLFWKNSRRE